MKARAFSRIGLRLLAFNVLLVFLPVAGLLALDVFEGHFLAAQERSMVQQGRLLAAALAERGPIDPADVQAILVRLDRRLTARLRIVDPKGVLLADSSRLGPRRTRRDADAASDEPRGDWLYRLVSGAFRFAGAPRGGGGDDAQAPDEFETAGPLRGPEIQAALEGRYGAGTRVSPGQRSLTLYSAIPIRSDERVVGAVLVSQSTFRLLQDLYDVRRAVLEVFLASLVVAAVLTLVASTTIARPLAALRAEAAALLDRRGRLRGRFSGSDRRDEIGDLARALQELSRRLEQRSEFVDSFAADVSHAFKNPLAGIRSAAELLEKTEEPERRARYRMLVQRDVARLERLLSTVREIARIDAELEDESREPLPLAELLGGILEAFRLRFGARMRFALDVDGAEGARVDAAPARLAEAFENLVDNATSFAPPGSEVRVELRLDGADAVVRVLDQGPGIPPEHLERVFDRFFSWRPEQDEPELAHMGLGLPIARAVVEGYGGSLIARESGGGGACFEARLPLLPQRSAPS